MISISLSPNVFACDIFASLKMLFLPWQWQQGKYEEKFKQQFSQYFLSSGTKFPTIYLTNSGRSALYLILQSLNIKQGDEILLQAFTCNAVSNPILWSKANPVYVDISDDYNMDINDLEKKITKNSKAIIVQHTFGIPAKIEQIIKIAREYNLIVIEDCAHSLGQELNGKKLGTFGDISFFSFGRDKIISSVYGGSILENKKISNLKSQISNLSYPSRLWILQQLFHPILMSVILFFYNIPFKGNGIGKWVLVLLQKSHIISKAVSYKEKQGEKPNFFPARLPNALAYLALIQFNRVEKFNDHRRKLVEFYNNKFKKYTEYLILNNKYSLIRFSIRHSNAKQIIKKARKKGILLGDWYNITIAPDDTNLDKMKYYKGLCPNAEKLSQQTLNLPTNPNLTLKKAQKIVNFILNQ
ncbi:MAG: DegT/DnrJ/EryC1/StrS aminotransferase [Parcubacteria group bacterium GW2011_GWA2_31_28]|nr:MAG: DegT/DnrJ/EryC1/StrS aminotransferase [Parcubacteria group bacterium GW2011_GWA2_31_28]